MDDIELDPHFRIGALTEALESIQNTCERLESSMPTEGAFVLRHLAAEIAGSLLREKARADKARALRHDQSAKEERDAETVAASGA